MDTKKLYRSCTDRMIGGVAGGLAEYLSVDSTIVRLIFLILLLSGGLGFVAYILAWVLIPEDPKCKNPKNGAEEIKEKAEALANGIRGKVGQNEEERVQRDQTFKIIFGLIILGIGVMFLLHNVIGFSVWRYIWPSVLIIIGLILIMEK